MKKIFFFLLFLSQLYINAQTSLPISNRFNNYLGFNISQSYPGWSEAKGFPIPVEQEASWFLSDVLFEKAACVRIEQTDKRDWLLSPWFNATENTQLSFRTAFTLFSDDLEPAIMGPSDFFKVYAIDQNNNLTELLVIDQSNISGTSMKSVTIPLSQFAGNQIRIGFVAIDGNNANSFATWHIDDVYITNANSPDVSAEQVLLPVWQQCLNENTPVVVRIKNNSSAAVTNIPVRVRIRGPKNQNLYNVYKGVLEPSQTVEINVGYADLNAEGNYKIYATTELTNDVFTENNVSDTQRIFKKNIRQLPLPKMDFTGYYTNNLSTLYPDWFEARGRNFPKIKMDTDWQGTDHPQSRTASVFFAMLGTRDWLVGPIIKPTIHTYIKFKAAYEWYQGPSQMGSDDSLAVMVSTDCGQKWIPVGVISQSTNLSTTLTEFSFSLAEFAGQTIRIAIYATTGNINDDEIYLIHIDDIEVKNIYPTDLTIGNMLSPQQSCSFSTNEILTIEIKNVGQNPVTNPQISYKLNDNPAVTEIYNGTINPNQIVQYAFSTPADLTTQYKNFITFEVYTTDDTTTSNNSMTYVVKPSSFDLNTMGDYHTSFEEYEDVSNWTVVNANNDNHFWKIVNDAQYSFTGINSYNYESNQSVLPSNDWLFSPCFVFEAGKTYYVRFYYKNRATAYPEKLRFNLCSSPNPQSVVQVLNDFGDITNSGYLPYSTTFQVSSTGEYYLAWEAYGPANMFGMYIDEVTIRRVFDNDLTIDKASVVRKKDINTCQLQPSDTINILVSNIGSQSINGFDVNIEANNGTSTIFLTQNYTQTINAGESTEIKFFNQLSLSPQYLWNIKVIVNAANDQNRINDTFLIQYLDLNTYTTSFEPFDDNAQWTVINLEGTNTWNLYNNANYAHSGNYSYRIRTDQQPTNDWLISSCQYLKAGICYELSFYYRSVYSYENLNVTIGPNPSPDGMTTIFSLENFYTNVYQKATTIFSVPQDGAYYIGFHTQGPTYQKYYIYIDDITLKVSEQQPSINPQYLVMDKEVLFFANGQFVNNYLWDFGNNNFSNEENPLFVFPGVGVYNVNLTASSTCGNVSKDLVVSIESNLSADFIFNVNNLKVNFEAITNAKAASWTFGDGNAATGHIIEHIYSVPGDYLVTLTVYDGITFEAISKTVTVNYLVVKDYNTSQLVIYPNPASTQIFIIGFEDNENIVIIDINGKVVRRFNYSLYSNNIDINSLSAGIYFVCSEKQRDKKIMFVKK